MFTTEELQAAMEDAEQAHHDAEKALQGGDKTVAHTMVVIVLGKTLKVMSMCMSAGHTHIVDALQPNVNLYMKAMPLIDKGDFRGALES